MPDLTVKQIVSVLKKVPEKRFSIMDLAPKLIDAKGKVDVVKAISQQGDLNLAIAEVDTYIRFTRKAVEALKYLDLREQTATQFGIQPEQVHIWDDEE